jgi:hypothetical protein
MGFLRRLFGGDRGPGEPSPDGAAAEEAEGTGPDANAHLHSVVAWVRLTDPTLLNEREQRRVFAIEDGVMRGLFDAGVGDLDTNELDRGFLAIRCVGPDADRMVAVMGPLLAEAPAGSYLAVRRGPAGTGEERVDLPVEGVPPTG